MPLAFTFASTAGATADDATRDGARAFNLPAGERQIAEAIRRFILLRYCTRDEEWSMVVVGGTCRRVGGGDGGECPMPRMPRGQS